jgi:hypothetical protein
MPETCVNLPFENMHLVPEHHDLDIPCPVSSSARHEEAEDSAKAEVKQGEGHFR